MLTTALGAVYPRLPASAQSPGVSIAQAGQRAFDIPSQPLNEALVAFGRQAGMSASADTSLTQNQRSAAIKGTMTWQQALTALLSGTGLTYRLNGSIVTLERVPGVGSGVMQLDPVQVQGVFPAPSQAMIGNLPPPYAGGQVATGGQLGFLGNRGFMDTPFNQTSYTAKLAEDQQARTVGDVLVNDPSVRSQRPARSGSSEFFTIRGFTVDTSEMQYGGLYGMLPYWVVDAAMVERVEVLKGPSAMLNGMSPGSSIGGVVNLVPKRAGDEPLTRVVGNYYSVGQAGAQIDIGRRFGSDKQFGVRFNGVYRDGETAVQWNNEALALVTLGLDFRGERLRLAADLGYQNQKIDGLVVEQASLALGLPVPAPPPATRSYDQPWSFAHRKDLFGAIRGEFDLTDRITLYAAFGARDDRLRILDAAGQTINNANGNIVSSFPYNSSQFYMSQTGQAGIRGAIDTGPINHEFNVGVAGVWQQSGTGFASSNPITSNIYNPIYMPQPILQTPAAPKSSDSSFTSIGIADTMSMVDGRIQLTVGARQQYVGANNYNTMGAVTSSYYEGALSPSVALVFKPLQNISVYGNFIQGLQQGLIVGPPFSNAGEIFPPYKATQHEVGVKADWGKFTTTVSAFQISQPSFVTDTTTNTLTLNGEQRNSGIELNFFGEPLDGVRLLGGAMFINPVLTKTQGGLNNGWWAPGVPNLTMNLAAEWDTPFVRGLTMNARVVYTGSQYFDRRYPRRTIPDWATFDAGVRYTFENPASPGKPLTLRFNVDNVLGANYWMASSLTLGQPRTFRLSLTADF